MFDRHWRDRAQHLQSELREADSKYGELVTGLVAVLYTTEDENIKGEIIRLLSGDVGV